MFQFLVAESRKLKRTHWFLCTALMTSTVRAMPHTFHFRFSEKAERAVAAFAEKHQAEPRLVYKAAWADWKDSHGALMKEEERRLRQLGYLGDVEDKMYKAGRYYFGRTRLRTREPPPPNAVPHDEHRYRRVGKGVLAMMDTQIRNHMGDPTWTPQRGLAELLGAEPDALGADILRMERDWGMEREVAADKLKRTYKNRYQKERRRMARGRSILTGVEGAGAGPPPPLPLLMPWKPAGETKSVGHPSCR